MTDLAILQSCLGEAENAYHLAVTGGKEVSVNIGGYGAVTYQTADAPKLEKHIAHSEAGNQTQTGRFRSQGNLCGVVNLGRFNANGLISSPNILSTPVIRHG